MPTVIAKNVDVADVEIEDLGTVIPVSGQETLTDNFTFVEIADSKDLKTEVQNATIVINDGTSDLSMADGLSHISVKSELETDNATDERVLRSGDDMTGELSIQGYVKIKHATDSKFDIIIDPNAGRHGALGASISKGADPNGGGFLSFFPNSEVSQFLFGDPAAANGDNRLYFDVDNQGDMYINVLPGAGKFANVYITQEGVLAPATDNKSQLGTASLRWENVHGANFRGGSFHGDGENLTGIEYMLPIWAEENAALGAGNHEWAFGNGANTPSDRGIPIFVPTGYTCEIVAMSLSINAGTATVEVNLNGSNLGVSDGVEVAVASGNHAVAEISTPYGVSNGDVLNFRTRLASGTSGPCQVCAYLRFTKTSTGQTTTTTTV